MAGSVSVRISSLPALTPVRLKLMRCLSQRSTLLTPQRADDIVRVIHEAECKRDSPQAELFIQLQAGCFFIFDSRGGLADREQMIPCRDMSSMPPGDISRHQLMAKPI